MVKEEDVRQLLREWSLSLNALRWFVHSPLSWCKRTPASDHQGVKCTLRESPMAPHCGPNDVWNVLIKFCLFILLTIRLMGWELSGFASNNPHGNHPDRVSFLTSCRQVFLKWYLSIHLNWPLWGVAACMMWGVWSQCVFLSSMS